MRNNSEGVQLTKEEFQIDESSYTTVKINVAPPVEDGNYHGKEKVKNKKEWEPEVIRILIDDVNKAINYRKEVKTEMLESDSNNVSNNRTYESAC